ncbi:MAG: hypothetical protein JO129_00465 [Candidatus Dependentiae bacterium]|nr:hypothetical protein [Candidatus Dependentiae bacterium]
MVEMFYTLSITFPVTLAALGTGIGQGLIGFSSLKALNTQPHAATEIRNVSLIGMSLTETAGILGCVVSLVLFYDTSIPVSYEYAAYGKMGIAFAIGLSSLVAGIAASLPAQAACLSVARQPFFSNKILQFMLITQTVIMTPNIFGFVMALLINSKTQTIFNFPGGLQLLSSGLAIGLGSIGPCIGLSIFAHAACMAIGVNRKAYGKILAFTFLSEGIIETPAIFSLLISLVIWNFDVVATTSDLQGIGFLAAALCIGFSTMGTGISGGKTGATACTQIGNNPDIYSTMSRIGFLALAMIDTFAIYGFIVSIILIYFAA